MRALKIIQIGLLLMMGIGAISVALGKEITNAIPASVVPSESLAAALSPAQWAQVESCVDRALAWIATQQVADGSFPTLPAGQPAVTSLCVLAFLSRSHQPGIGPYGAQLNRAIDFVLSCQRSDGLFSYATPGTVYIPNTPSHTAVYNHAIAGLMLSEVFGHVTGQRSKNIRHEVQKALQYTRSLQTRPKKYPTDKGGWRYLPIQAPPHDADSDLSITGWQLMFLRSARNAEFTVPQQYVDEALNYIHHTWDDQAGRFHYEISAGYSAIYSRGLMGSGILALSLGGQHRSPEALAAGDWLLAHPFRAFGEVDGEGDRFFYSTYYCSQAAAQLGGHYWAGIFPPIASIMLKIQNADGSFPVDPRYDGIFGPAYSSAMAVLSLTPAYQLLPVYQR